MGQAEEGFDVFVETRSTALLRTAYLLCAGDRGAAEDLLQDVLERTYGKWRKIDSAPEAYVRAALANAAANRWRHRSRRVREAPLEEVIPPSEPGHEERVADRDALLRALAELPQKMRAAVVLRYFDDLTEAQAAHALGCGVGTIKSQTSRGLARLRDLLDPVGADTTADQDRGSRCAPTS
ncbi:SigE family RNA polymerase sigma factor [Crossiella cryophila]|uniref:RNA polymerase sigma-70 factor (Sigma-E family) n=1 Tax=Crossiella cryophila TaxID=43355 RepID=A0A7W7CJH6_9PSEU|nr:SigE family RNA polymerase sigma factor [Crossiella cryophila]MBB4682316.1 RNA polymerase sigma-70 factor (sigma-E family) [Crossiella cryophila]